MLAQEEARKLRHDHIGTEHILLGLLRRNGASAHLLEGFGVTLEKVHAEVARIVGLGDEVGAGQIPFTPRAKKVLELSLREALDNNETYIAPEHLLLALLRERDGIGARILAGFTDLDEIRSVLIKQARAGKRSKLESAPMGGTVRSPASEPLIARAGYLPGKALSPLLVGWLLFAVALGVGLLIGWSIWGR